MSKSRRLAPAFQVEVSAQPMLQAVIAALSGLAGLSGLLALLTHLPQLWPLLLGLPIFIWTGWHAAKVRPRLLRWDGQVWRLKTLSQEGEGIAVQLQVVWDLGNWMLLRAQWLPVSGIGTRLGFARRIYLPVSEAKLAAYWVSLRATLFSARQDRT